MKLWQKILIGVVAVIVLTAGGGYAFVKSKNQPPQLAKPNYFEYYKNQDTVPEGKVGIFISHLIMPTKYKQKDFENLAMKSMQYIPWPIRNQMYEDEGVVLLDSEKFYEFKKFEPTNLVDHTGSNKDTDGVSYMDKYKNGEVIWVPPSPRLHFDHGYFLYTSRQAGMPTRAAKLATKARVYYYGENKGFVSGMVPHESGNWQIVKATMAKVQAKYGDVPWQWVTAEDFELARELMHQLLDKSVDTVLLGAPRPIYSHHEEFNGAIRHAMHYIEEWEKENKKEIKVIITPQLGEFDVIRQTYINMLRDRLARIPKTESVKVVASVHGMAWDRVPLEAWIELAPKYRDGTVADLRSFMETQGYAKWEVVQSQDHFADPINNPNGTYLSTNKAFWDGIEEGYDYVINLPIEFFAENTDTMFSHAMYNFEGFPGFDIYEPVDYSDWSKPYTRTFNIEGTKVIYNGVPVGKYNKPIVEAYFQAIDSVLSQASNETPIASR